LPHESSTAFEQAAKTRIGQEDRLDRRLSRPILLEDRPAQLIDIGEIAAVEPLFLDDMPDERLLQVGAISARGHRLIGEVVVIGDVDR